MSFLLTVGSILSFLFGALQYLVAHNVMQQIVATGFLIASAVLFSGAAIVGKLSDTNSRLRHLLDSKTHFPDGTPAPSFLAAVGKSLGETLAGNEPPPTPNPEPRPAQKTWVEQAREEIKSSDK